MHFLHIYLSVHLHKYTPTYGFHHKVDTYTQSWDERRKSAYLTPMSFMYEITFYHQNSLGLNLKVSLETFFSYLIFFLFLFFSFLLFSFPLLFNMILLHTHTHTYTNIRTHESETRKPHFVPYALGSSKRSMGCLMVVGSNPALGTERTSSFSFSLSHTHTYTHAHTHIHTRIHAYTHAHTRTHTHLQLIAKKGAIVRPGDILLKVNKSELALGSGSFKFEACTRAIMKESAPRIMRFVRPASVMSPIVIQHILGSTYPPVAKFSFEPESETKTAHLVLNHIENSIPGAIKKLMQGWRVQWEYIGNQTCPIREDRSHFHAYNLPANKATPTSLHPSIPKFLPNVPPSSSIATVFTKRTLLQSVTPAGGPIRVYR